MNHSGAGQFWGVTNKTLLFEGLTITDTEYSYKFIDWHYHENPYFSFVTKGQCREINKRETIECSTDSLLFHNVQDPHCNSKPGGVSTGFNVEMSFAWCNKFAVELEKLPNGSEITNPNIKLLFYNIYKEAKLSDDTSNLTIDALLLQTIAIMRGIESEAAATKPTWVKKVDEILRDSFDQTLSLQKLSRELDLHAAHLSRDFARYFRCNFSQYVRKIRIEKSLHLLRNKALSLTEIALNCGFADQSHFIRCFKEFNGITPKKFRQIIS